MSCDFPTYISNDNEDDNHNHEIITKSNIEKQNPLKGTVRIPRKVIKVWAVSLGPSQQRS